MKQWVKKLVDQLDVDLHWNQEKDKGHSNTKEHLAIDLNEDRATLLFLIDVFNKNLFEIEGHNLRKTRQTFDTYSKDLINPETHDKVLFNLRQFFSSYRVNESAYVQSTFEDFKKIIWDFADQLSEEIHFEQLKDDQVEKSFEQLKEAVESNSIEQLRSKSKEFINQYIKIQSEKSEKREKRLSSIRKNLSSVKKKLMQANHTMMTDHLTQAYNRRSFDEQLRKSWQMYQISKSNYTLIIFDIDHFKKINDRYGHDIGDYVIKECVNFTKSVFHREEDFLARIGGEEFALILPDYAAEHAVKKAEEALKKIASETYIHGEHQIKFTVSMGIAQLCDNESFDQWFKRADQALYESKNTGRNKYTLSSHLSKVSNVA